MSSQVEMFLKDRDKRVAFQRELVSKHGKTLICLRVNYPGINRNNLTTRRISLFLSEKIEEMFNDDICFKNRFVSMEGPIVLYLVDLDSRMVKNKCIDLEQTHPLGRFVDIDVYDENYNSLSRKDFDLPPRLCYLCNKDAYICVRSRTHSIDEIISYINDKLILYLKEEMINHQE